MKVGVVFGGRSVEHDVSIVTAQQVMAALGERHDVVPIYVDREGLWFAGDALRDPEVWKARQGSSGGPRSHVGEAVVLPPVRGYRGLMVSKGLRPKKIDLDVVVPAIHGTFGEDGTLQGLLDLADIPYTGSGVTASAVGMDKVAMKAAFRAADLPVVDDFVIDASRLSFARDEILDGVESSVGYPCFVKPVKAGSSVGIAKVKDREDLAEAIEVASRYDRRLLVERSMEDCIEINCSVLGGPGSPPQASVCEQPVRWEEFLSFEDKYMRGGKSQGSKQGMASLERKIPAPISEAVTKQVQDNALRAFAAIDGAGVARIDSFVDEATGETWLMEINTTPGSFAFYLWEASGLSFPDLMDRLLDIAIEGHRERSELMFTFDSGLLEKMGGGKTGG